MDIKPKKLIKGYGLAKILSKENCQAMGLNLLAKNFGPNVVSKEGQSSEKDSRIAYKYLFSDWYKPIVHYFVFLECP